MLQFFVEQEPPVINQDIMVNITSANPLNLGSFFVGGEFFEYGGSETTPPCDEKVTWYVRRNAVKASDAQVKAMSDAIYKMSAEAGNYRTVMPLNKRIFKIYTAEENDPAPKPFTMQPPVGPPFGFDDGRESKWVDVAKDAVTIAKASADYARDLDARLTNGAQQHYEILKPGETFTTTPTPTTNAVPIPPKMNWNWGMNALSKAFADQVRNAIYSKYQQMHGPVEQLTKSYLRQDLLMRAGFTTLAPPPASTTAAPVREARLR